MFFTFSRLLVPTDAAKASLTLYPHKKSHQLIAEKTTMSCPPPPHKRKWFEIQGGKFFKDKIIVMNVHSLVKVNQVKITVID